ncbi:MAG: glycosyltransferase family 92 protein [Selenomonadaceae bacterium]|nr:glycosyltransferase family 92 protein [Selenomonadaceae bacterium]
MVDKNLFLHDLAVVAILKNEGAYLKEWLDYHLLAGVDHFYLFDNDSPDNQAEVAAPYVKAGLVDYFHAPGKMMQMVAYNETIKNFKFHCRYMAFIDLDEFIFPKTNQSIAETLDGILSLAPNAAGVAINWQIFGSNGHETADLTRGVLERFTRRALNDSDKNEHIKTVANPRTINFSIYPHHANYFEGLHAVNENGKIVSAHLNRPVTADKIALNHYYTKSREEFLRKVNKGRGSAPVNYLKAETFTVFDCNEIFDDGILKYRAARAENFSLENNNEKLKRVIETLTQILSGTPANLETALTCLAVSSYLRENVLPEMSFCEELSLKKVVELSARMNFVEASLLIRELPKILRLPYPDVKKIRAACLEIIPQMLPALREKVGVCRDYIELDYLQDFLKE